MERMSIVLAGAVSALLSCFSEDSEPSDAGGTRASATNGDTTSATATATTGDDTSANSGSASAEATSGGASDSSSGMTDPDPADPYGRCYEVGVGGCGAPLQCGEWCVRNFEADEQVCSWGCGDALPCPEPLDGDAPAVCAPQPSNHCVLDCSEGQTCPTGMVCAETAFAASGPFTRACAWPTTTWLPPYSRCFPADGRVCAQCELAERPAVGCVFDDAQCAASGLDPACTGVCATQCGGELGACPEPDGGTAPATCVGCPGNVTFCVLDCSQGTCPDGMECGAFEGCDPPMSFPACMWPPA